MAELTLDATQLSACRASPIALLARTHSSALLGVSDVAIVAAGSVSRQQPRVSGGAWTGRLALLARGGQTKSQKEPHNVGRCRTRHGESPGQLRDWWKAKSQHNNRDGVSTSKAANQLSPGHRGCYSNAVAT